ncbi:MlaC/ttg2D family ABC transporter substrate-binding protein [Methylobacterium radiodurans]|uniref:Toluene tolerance protein n=1 Tax=Methylobacterium radiodurans TaxID=2202828 RepID=A0A2U8VXL6_9HYPH|nr:ABC transporter substrate-binding protein [Methylobacterium radiodurans]AWN38533.1 toluene tolerance protein [Methylobacterium radiodurans]
MRLIRSALIALLMVAAPVARAADDPGVATVKALYESFAAAVKDGGGTLQQRVEAVGPTIERSFDFPHMLRLAVGQSWSGFTPEQQGALTEAFRRNFVTTYANRLKQAAGGRFEVLGSERRESGSIVQTKVTTPDNDESQIDFVANSEGRVTDVLLNGNVSEVATQRTVFNQPLKAGGADGLLKFLRQRTETMLSAKPAP